MSWHKEVEELKRRRALAEGMGGPEKLKRQRDAGRLNARERIAAVADPGSFHEIGGLAGFGRYDEAGELTGFTPSNFLFGRARVDGRPVVLTAATTSQYAAAQRMPRSTASSSKPNGWRTNIACH